MAGRPLEKNGLQAAVKMFVPQRKSIPRRLVSWGVAIKEKCRPRKSVLRGHGSEKIGDKVSPGKCVKRCYWSLILFLAMSGGVAFSGEQPAFEDYCARLEQEIQGRKHGFMAGNLSYYVGGFHASWELMEDETIGLTHPFHHDLRSRGVGLLESELKGSEHTGVGNDYQGWEFYKDTRVLYGSVLIDGRLHVNPKPRSMRWRPDKLICEYEVGGVQIKEVKFIGSNDAAASVISSSEPVILHFSGHSFYHRNSVSSSATVRVDKENNSLIIREGGIVRSRPDPEGPERTGPMVYEGMSTVLSSSRGMKDTIELNQDRRGVQHYEFSVPCDRKGTVVAWAMNDKPENAVRAARTIIEEHPSLLAAKTAECNRELNDEIPWFRCSDRRFVDVYYYLWSLYLMYYIEVGKGWENEPHTQTAVNNFLGMHRYDAAFQIKVGGWTQTKSRYAYGNVLTWKHLTESGRYRETPDGHRLLSDNKGISWHSGAYGGETSEHVLGAWQIYQHTGDVEFLKRCYEGHFAELFWKRLSSMAMNQFEVADVLEKMARLAGHEDDVAHWRKMVKRDSEHVRQMFEVRWGMNGIPSYFAGPANGMLTTNGFWAMRSPYFPQVYAMPMLKEWALDKEKGFFGAFFPLAMSRQSMNAFATKVDHSFGYTPDTAYFTLDGLFKQGLGGEAASLTLNHIENYNYHSEWDIPVAPEAYRRDLSLFGDQFSNFNAGKILLYLEGLAGLKYSIPRDRMTVAPALPVEWDWMELRLPINRQWTRIRYERGGVQVTGCPLKVVFNQEEK